MSTKTLDRETDALALITPPDARDALAVFAAKDTEAADRIIAEVRAKAAEFCAMAPDVTTPAGRDLIRRFAHRITKSKTAIEAVGAALAAEQKEIPKRIDATRRHFKDSLDKLRDEVRKPLTDWEGAEEERVNRLEDGLAALQGAIDDPNWISRSSEQLRDRLAEIERDGDVSEARWDEYASAAAELRAKAIAVLTERIAAAEKREAEAAELAKLREAQAAREREDRERRIAEDAAAKAKADAAAAVTAAENARRATEQRAVEAAAKAKADAEREIMARQEAEAAEQRRREEDRAHRASIHRAALDALVAGGIAEDVAKSVITMIATGRVPAISIQY